MVRAITQLSLVSRTSKIHDQTDAQFIIDAAVGRVDARAKRDPR